MGVFDTGIKFLHVSISRHASMWNFYALANVHEFTQTWHAYLCTILHMLENFFVLVMCMWHLCMYNIAKFEAIYKSRRSLH